MQFQVRTMSTSTQRPLSQTSISSISTRQSLPRSLPRESENSLGTFSPPPPPACRPHRPAPRCTPAPRAPRRAPQGQPRVQAGGAAEARRRAALLKFRFRSLAVISRPRALRQACVSCDALYYFRATRSISLAFHLASRSRHGTATARRHRRARSGGGSRVLRARRVPSSPGTGAHRRRRARAMQQRHVRRWPVHAPRVLRAMGGWGARLSQVLRPSSLVVRTPKASKSMDQERIRFGVQGLRMPVWPWALEKRFGLGASGCCDSS